MTLIPGPASPDRRRRIALTPVAILVSRAFVALAPEQSKQLHCAISC